MEKRSSELTNHLIWDCGSSLYDSFELKSFEKQLDSAIASRTLSMPHFSDHRLLHPPPPPPVNKKPTSKISRSFHRLIRAVFRPKRSSVIITYKNDAINGEFGLFDSSEINLGFPEIHGNLPDQLKSSVRKTASERFTATSLGVFCS